jgi:hypothetical protein
VRNISAAGYLSPPSMHSVLRLLTNRFRKRYGDFIIITCSLTSSCPQNIQDRGELPIVVSGTMQLTSS